MSGLSSRAWLVLLAINVVYAYAAFLPIAAGQLNLGVAGFAAIGGYASAYLSTNARLGPPADSRSPLGGPRRRSRRPLQLRSQCCGRAGFIWRLPPFALGRNRAGR